MSQRTNPPPVAAQLRALRDFAEKHDRPVVREYVDEAITSPHRSPATIAGSGHGKEENR